MTGDVDLVPKSLWRRSFRLQLIDSKCEGRWAYKCVMTSTLKELPGWLG